MTPSGFETGESPRGDSDDRARPKLPPLTGSPHVTPGLGRLGMIILLISLSVLFIASLIGYVWVRRAAPQWPPEGISPLPRGLWISTALLLVSSGTMHAALRGIRRGDLTRYAGWLVVTFVLGLSFLILQALNWWELVAVRITPRGSLYGYTFFMLTGLHALHVIGGLIPLGIVARRARRGWYRMEHHPGVEHVAMYWHFLDAVWLVLFVVLVVVG